jgi:hypothetical protein
MHHLEKMLAEPTAPPGWQRPLEVVLTIVGLIAVVLGIVILLGGDDQYVGLWGDGLSWRVGDIDSGWGIGLLLGGIGAIVAAGVSYVERHR